MSLVSRYWDVSSHWYFYLYSGGFRMCGELAACRILYFPRANEAGEKEYERDIISLVSFRENCPSAAAMIASLRNCIISPRVLYVLFCILSNVSLTPSFHQLSSFRCCPLVRRRSAWRYRIIHM